MKTYNKNEPKMPLPPDLHSVKGARVRYAKRVEKRDEHPNIKKELNSTQVDADDTNQKVFDEAIARNVCAMSCITE